MGMFNTIVTKEDMKCLKCKKTLRYITEHHDYKNKILFQSKDMFSRGNLWYVGDKITFQDGLFKFTTEGNDVWTGVHGCPHCHAYHECDIIIEKGFVKEIKNLRINSP